MEYTVPARFRELDEKRESLSELLRIGSTSIKILVVDTSTSIDDVPQDNQFE